MKRDFVFNVEADEAEEYISTPDFWDEIPTPLIKPPETISDILAHVMGMIDPVNVPDWQPTTADVLSVFSSMRAVKRLAMEAAKEAI